MNREQMINDLILRGWSCVWNQLGYRGLVREGVFIGGQGVPLEKIRVFGGLSSIGGTYGDWAVFNTAEIVALRLRALGQDGL